MYIKYIYVHRWNILLKNASKEVYAAINHKIAAKKLYLIGTEFDDKEKLIFLILNKMFDLSIGLI